MPILEHFWTQAAKNLRHSKTTADYSVIISFDHGFQYLVAQKVSKNQEVDGLDRERGCLGPETRTNTTMQNESDNRSDPPT